MMEIQHITNNEMDDKSLQQFEKLQEGWAYICPLVLGLFLKNNLAEMKEQKLNLTC